MNRRSFLGMVAAVAAATVGALKRPKVQESNLYGSRMIETPSRPVIFAQNHLNPNSIMSRIHRGAYNRPPHGMDYEIDPPDGVVSIKITNLRSSTGVRSVASLSNMTLAKR